MDKKAKIIATLGPSISSEKMIKKLVKQGVDAFRINFSHNTKNIKKTVFKIRKVEKNENKESLVEKKVEKKIKKSSYSKKKKD